jgi:hypothetical protein
LKIQEELIDQLMALIDELRPMAEGDLQKMIGCQETLNRHKSSMEVGVLQEHLQVAILHYRREKRRV